MSLATEKDEVLTRLNESWEIDLLGMEFLFPEPSEERFYNLFFKHRFELEQAGYIEFYESDAVLIDVQRTRMNPAGRVFLQNGGYTAIEQNIQAQEERARVQEERALAEEEQKRSEWKRKRFYEPATLFVGIGGLFVAIGALIFAGLTYFTTPKGDSVEKKQPQIDTVRKEAKQLRVGAVRKEIKKLLKPKGPPSVK